MSNSSDQQTPQAPEALLAQVTAEYQQYLEIAEVSRIPVGEVEPETQRPAPQGLVLWPS